MGKLSIGNVALILGGIGTLLIFGQVLYEWPLIWAGIGMGLLLIANLLMFPRKKPTPKKDADDE